MKHHEIVSPIDGNIAGSVSLVSKNELKRSLNDFNMEERMFSKEEVFAFLDRLKNVIKSRQDELCHIAALEMGYIQSDCRENVDAAIDFLQNFEQLTHDVIALEKIIPHTFSDDINREIRLTTKSSRPSISRFSFLTVICCAYT